MYQNRISMRELAANDKLQQLLTTPVSQLNLSRSVIRALTRNDESGRYRVAHLIHRSFGEIKRVKGMGPVGRREIIRLLSPCLRNVGINTHDLGEEKWYEMEYGDGAWRLIDALVVFDWKSNKYLQSSTGRRLQRTTIITAELMVISTNVQAGAVKNGYRMEEKVRRQIDKLKAELYLLESASQVLDVEE